MRPCETLVKTRNASRPEGMFDGAVEIKRNEFSKKWKLKDGKYHVSNSIAPIHWKDEDGNWQEIDTTLRYSETDAGPAYVVDQAPYIALVYPDRVGWRHISRKGGYMEATLPDANTESVEVNDDTFRWIDAYPGVDVELQCRRVRTEVRVIIKEPTARRDFMFRLEESPDFGGRLLDKYRGWDAEERSANMSMVRDGERLAVSWDGRVSEIVDRRTRQKRWVDDPAYPVVLDPSISEVITSGPDDVHSLSGFPILYTSKATMLAGFSGAAGVLIAGIRFPTIAIPGCY